MANGEPPIGIPWETFQKYIREVYNLYYEREVLIMFREIRTQERLTEKDFEEEKRKRNYLEIKPETEITVKEARDHLRGLFMVKS